MTRRNEPLPKAGEIIRDDHTGGYMVVTGPLNSLDETPWPNARDEALRALIAYSYGTWIPFDKFPAEQIEAVLGTAEWIGLRRVLTRHAEDMGVEPGYLHSDGQGMGVWAMFFGFEEVSALLENQPMVEVAE